MDVLGEAFRSMIEDFAIILSWLEYIWLFVVDIVNIILYVSQLFFAGIQAVTQLVNSFCIIASDLLIQGPSSFVEFILTVTTEKIPSVVKCVDAFLAFLFGLVSSCFTLANDLCILVVELCFSLGNAFDRSLKNGSLGLYLCLAIVGMAFTCTVLEMFVKLMKRCPILLTWRRKSTSDSITSNSLDFVLNCEKSTLCSVCLTEERSIVILPCTHFCLCSQCSSKLSDNNESSVLPTCPICRQQIREFMPIISSWNLQRLQLGRKQWLHHSLHNSDGTVFGCDFFWSSLKWLHFKR